MSEKEAQDLLADFEKKQRDAEAIAAKIIEDAKASARLVQEQAEQDLTSPCSAVKNNWFNA